MHPIDDHLLGIGELSRTSRLSVSALRFYDREGVLAPAEEPRSSFRGHSAERFRGSVQRRTTLSAMQPALLDRARTVSQRHADLLRGALGEEVLAVWLVGSAMLGDLTEDSDVDTVTLTDPEHADALREVHDTLAREFEGVRYDTTYLTADAIARPPEPGVPIPFSQDGQLHLGESCGEVHAVTWLSLPHAVPVAGVGPDDLAITADRSAAAAHSRENLHSYWARVSDQAGERLAGRDPDEPLASQEGVLWMTLGAPRLEMLVARAPCGGPIPSKTEADGG
ncbi:MAG: MerR family DNA-binding transcriptional regulator [Actinomycetota bacterium]|nr:MerR family DNA-binding transcriptional regulator [Actinomycetota bacterium]